MAPAKDWMEIRKKRVEIAKTWVEIAWPHDLWDEQGHLPDFSKLLRTAAGLRKSTKWVMQIGIWGQFRGPETRSMAPLCYAPAQD